MAALAAILFVAQSFDGVEARGANGRHHPADQPNSRQDQYRNHQRHGINDQPDVTRLGMFGHGAIKCQASNRERNNIRKNNSKHAAQKRNGERFGQELQEDVSSTCAQRFFNSEFHACAASPRQSMMFIRPTPPIPSVSVPMNMSRIFRPMVDEFQLVYLVHQIDDGHCSTVEWVKPVLRCQDEARRLLDPAVIVGLVVEPDGVEDSAYPSNRSWS